MPNNKSPGPDGFPAEFYKHFWNSLSHIFNRLTDEIKQQSKLPIDMNTTTIFLLLKPNKDPTSPSSYRPLSAICQKTNIKGIQTENMHHKICLYADDILLFFTKTSLPETIDLINTFSKISDYTINWCRDYR